jgi:hypothetical protein
MVPVRGMFLEKACQKACTWTKYEHVPDAGYVLAVNDAAHRLNAEADSALYSMEYLDDESGRKLLCAVMEETLYLATSAFAL